MKCKITKDRIKPFMSFGKMPIANGFIKKNNFKNEFFFDLEVGFSKKLSLFQLNNHPKPEQMFNNNYPFFTSSSNYMVKHFKDFSSWIKKNYGKNLNYLVEIGSNDGSFLENFKKSKVKTFGFEPSKNVALLSKKRGIKTFNNFFNSKSVRKLDYLKKKVDLITAANVICHVPNLNNLIKSIDFLLDKKGLFIFEEPYLGSMYKKTSYDQIYDEHIYMFSVTSINKIFKLHNFELIDVLPQKTHGGSMRYVISRIGENKIKNSVKKNLNYESKNNINNFKGCINFKKKCEESKKKLINKIYHIKKRNEIIAGYGATSKSTTILNYCKIGNDLIDYICDTTPEKIDKYSPGMHIPIVSMKHFKKNKPDSVFLFAWNHKDEILKKEKKFIKKDKWFAHVKI